MIGEGPNKIFPQHVAYAGGSIKPNHVTQEEMDETVIKYYKEWKEKYLKADPYTGNNPTQKYVWYGEGKGEETDSAGVVSTPITVSEAHGYGMMITALMAGHDPDAQDDFDAMYRYFRAHPSEINSNLMAWQQGDTGSAIVDINGADSATDGDMDIAYSLILASQQWGNDGDIDYLAEAKTVINAIMDSEVDKTDWTLGLADWANSGKYAGATRPSDWMLQHLKDFKNVTGDSRWDNVINSTYNVLNSLYENYSPDAGLLPDFVVKDGKEFVPAPPSFLESQNDGDYYYNSARIPWRIATDYLLTGDDRAKGQLSTLNSWIRETTNNNPRNIMAGYKLDGSAAIANWRDLTFTAPLMVSAMIDSSNQQWLNDLWDYTTATSTAEEVYFGNNIRMLSLIVVSGNWWAPTIVDTEAPTEAVIDKANVVSETEVELEWLPSTDNLGVAGYKVFRNEVEIAETTDTKFTDSGLTPHTDYSYLVIAFDAAGNTSLASNIRVITTTLSDVDEEAPTAPQDVTGKAVSTTAIDLTWTASTDDVGVTGYKVFRDEIEIGTTTTPSYSDTGLTANTAYDYSVKAFDAAGNLSELSNVSVITTLAEDPGKDPGKDPGEDPGKDPGEDPGKDPGEDPGKDPGEDPGKDPGEDPGKDPGEDPGKDPGEDPGKDPGEDPGKDPGEDPGKDPGEDQEKQVKIQEKIQ